MDKRGQSKLDNNRKQTRKETDLYPPLKRYWEKQGYAVKGEVQGCDLVAMKEGQDEPVIVEIKKTVNLSLVLQGLDRQRMSGIVYIAAERKLSSAHARYERWAALEELCRKLGLGLITVQFYKKRSPRVDIVCHPESEIRPRRSVSRKRLLVEFRERSGDYNIGGSTGVKLLTAYREKALRCAYVLEQAGELSPSKVRDKLSEPKAASILQRNVYGWFLRVRRGVYALTPEGKQAVQQYLPYLKKMGVVPEDSEGPPACNT